MMLKIRNHTLCMTDESNFGKFFVSQNAVVTLSHIENVTINSHTLQEELY